VARVFLREGNGDIKVNGKKVDDYFGNPSFVYVVKQPLAVTDTETKYDILINVKGGGPSGQAGACRHGIARSQAARSSSPILAMGMICLTLMMTEVSPA
ncbi:MAG TPA: 30S ribosomal protein S9, partial [Sulfuricurvum sp.]|nr:30S ribosomal protein S9 [Sulfuricurvum sp.]